MAGPGSLLPRTAVVDLGSNSVRLVVFEGLERTPMPIFNEKAVLRLGKGLTATGMLNEAAIEPALRVMVRYGAVARAMGAETFEILATAAVRDAANGPAFANAVRAKLPGVPLRILTGLEEAALSAEGVRCGIPEADGVLADIGGGSLEVGRMGGAGVVQSASLGLGVIRLADRSEGDLLRARAIADAELGCVKWLQDGVQRDLYLVGGAFRALARVQMVRAAYPLSIVQHYTLDREAALDLASQLVGPRRNAERWAGTSRRRVEDLPMAAVVLRRLLRRTGASRVVWSANGIREGWFMQLLSAEERGRDAVLAGAQEIARRYGRDIRLPPALLAWTTPLFGHETAAETRLREAACWLSDTGAHDHPEYRAEQAFLRVLRQPGVAIDHPARAFLALTVALRYEAELDAPYLAPARALLTPEATRRAEILGTALRLAYVLSAGTTALLAGTTLRLTPGRLALLLAEGTGVFAGESVQRRLDRLAGAMGVAAEPVG